MPSRAAVSFSHGGSGLTAVIWNGTNFLKSGLPVPAGLEWTTMAGSVTNVPAGLTTRHGTDATVLANALAGFGFAYASTNDEFWIHVTATNRTTNFILQYFDFHLLEAQFPNPVREIQPPYFNQSVTADERADTFALAGNHLRDGMTVRLAAAELPGGLAPGREYVVRDRTEATFKVAEVFGGNPVDLTSPGRDVTVSSAAPFAGYYQPSLPYDGPNIQYWDFESGSCAFCLRPAFDRPVRLSAGASAPWTNLTLTLRTRADFLVDNQDRLVRRPLWPGETRRLSFSWTFSPLTNARSTVAGAAIAEWTNQFPFLLSAAFETNRAPLIALVTSSHFHRGPLNPGGFAGQPAGNVHAPAFYRHFLFNYLTNAVRHASNWGAQAVIFWSLEEERLPHGHSYVGDPREIPPWALPHLDDAVAFITNNSSGGRPLKVGFLIRPQLIRRALHSEAAGQIDLFSNRDILVNLSNKIAFIMSRPWSNWVWGFYIDSAGYADPNAPLHSEIYAALRRRWPSIRFLLEQATTGAHRLAATYRAYGVTGLQPGEPVTAVYAGAHSFVQIQNTNWQIYSNALVDAIRAGHTGLIIEGDQPPGYEPYLPRHIALSNIYRRARTPAP